MSATSHICRFRASSNDDSQHAATSRHVIVAVKRSLWHKAILLVIAIFFPKREPNMKTKTHTKRSMSLIIPGATGTSARGIPLFTHQGNSRAKEARRRTAGEAQGRPINTVASDGTFCESSHSVRICFRFAEFQPKPTNQANFQLIPLI